jgi:VWFA-related protein
MKFGVLAAVVFLPAYGQEPSFRSSVNLVLMDVSVTDSTGRPAADLALENFEIRENGAPQTISRFALGSAAVSVAIVVDYSGSMKPRYGAVAASIGEVLRELRPSDEAMLLSFNEQVRVRQPLAMLESSASQTWGATLLAEPPTGQTSLYDAVIRASTELGTARHERRVLIVLSDGEDTTSEATLQEAVQALQSSNRLVYCIGLFKPGDQDTDAGALRKLADSTGGVALFTGDGGKSSSDLRARLSEVLRDLRSRYILEFHSMEPLAGKTEVRKLSVTARDPGGKRLKVRARGEYRVTGPELKER